MTIPNLDLSLRKAALVAGSGYLGILVLGLFANFVVLDRIVVRGDAATTARNILGSESLFRMGIVSWLIVLMIDAIVAWALYLFLKPVSASLSLLVAWLRLVFVAIVGSSLVNLYSTLQLLTADTYEVFEPSQVDALASLLLQPYEYGFNVGFIFFGAHILGLGYLIIKADYMPRIIGILLIISSVGYLIDSLASLLSRQYGSNETFFVVLVAVPALIAEYSLALWLLVRGGKQGALGAKSC